MLRSSPRVLKDSPQDTNNLHIIAASWGLLRVTSKVIDLVNRQANPQSLSVLASNDVFGDGWFGSVKTLIVVYRYGETGTVGVATATEGNTLSITSPRAVVKELLTPTAPQLTVLAARYGPQDKTAAVQAMINGSPQELSLVANNRTFGDTWPGERKSFTLVAAYTGQAPFIDIVAEGSAYTLKYRPPLSILSAAWGLVDVTNTVQSLTSMRTLSITASNDVLGVDGWPWNVKTLAVVYQYGSQQPQLAIATEGAVLSFDYTEKPNYRPAPDAGAFNVIAAAYGRADVTSKVSGLLSGGNILDFTANNALFGDSWPSHAKVFVLSYSWGPRTPQILTVVENGGVHIRQPSPNSSPGLFTHHQREQYVDAAPGSLVESIGRLDIKPIPQDSQNVASDVKRMAWIAAASEGLDVEGEEDEEDLEDQLQAIAIRRKLRALRKRRTVPKIL